MERGEYARARSLFEERLALCRELGNKEGTASALFLLAQMLFFSLGDQVRVRTLLEEGHALWKEVGDKEGLATGPTSPGGCSQRGRYCQCTHVLEEYLQFSEQGQRHAIADALSVLGRIALPG